MLSGCLAPLKYDLYAPSAITKSKRSDPRETLNQLSINA